jgi:hypothetical protein
MDESATGSANFFWSNPFEASGTIAHLVLRSRKGLQEKFSQIAR